MRLADPPTRSVEAFRQGLRELGYVEEKTSALSIDMPKGRLTASRLAAELVQSQS